MPLEEDDKLSEVKPRPKPVVLLLLDGFGVALANEGNAMTSAKTPNIAKIIKKYPVALLSSSSADINNRYTSLGSCLSETLSATGLKQLKVSETIRFAALANFFNGGRDDKLPGEEWKVISSVSKGKELKRTSVVNKIFSELTAEISKGDYDFIAASVPNIEIMASTGDFEATKKAISEIDSKLKGLVDKIIEKDACLIISSAAGNAEKMLDFSTDSADSGLTANPVPFMIVGSLYEGKTIGLADPVNGDLSLLAPAGTFEDLAPTVLSIMNLDKPINMPGQSLI